MPENGALAQSMRIKSLHKCTQQDQFHGRKRSSPRLHNSKTDTAPSWSLKGSTITSVHQAPIQRAEWRGRHKQHLAQHRRARPVPLCWEEQRIRAQEAWASQQLRQRVDGHGIGIGGDIGVDIGTAVKPSGSNAAGSPRQRQSRIQG